MSSECFTSYWRCWQNATEISVTLPFRVGDDLPCSVVPLQDIRARVDGRKRRDYDACVGRSRVYAHFRLDSRRSRLELLLVVERNVVDERGGTLYLYFKRRCGRFDRRRLALFRLVVGSRTENFQSVARLVPVVVMRYAL